MRTRKKGKIQVSVFCKGLKGDAENWCNNRLSSDVYDSIVDIWRLHNLAPIKRL